MRLILLFMIISCSLCAAPVGNTANQALMSGSYFKITTGYLADYISDMRLSLASGKGEFNPSKMMHRFSLHSQMAECSLSLFNRIELYTLLGGSKESVKLRNETPTPLYSALLEFQSSYHFSWAVGTRMIVLQWGPTFLSAEGSYFSVPTSQKTFFKFLNRINLPLDANEQHLRLREWQVGASLSAAVLFLVPYVGVKYSHSMLRIQEGSENTRLTYHNSPRVGYYFGVTVSILNKMFLVIEKRIKSEEAYMGSLFLAF